MFSIIGREAGKPGLGHGVEGYFSGIVPGIIILKRKMAFSFEISKLFKLFSKRLKFKN